MTLGASLTIVARLGAGPWDSFNVGLKQTLGFTVGGWSIVIGLILILINALIAQKMPDLGGAVTVTVSGLFIDIWLLLVMDCVIPLTMPSRLTTLIIGIILIALGIATYLQANWSPSPIDDLMVSLRTRFHVSIGVSKTIGEVLALVLAILVQGPIGIGTLVITLGLGPFVSFFYAFWEKVTPRQ